MKWEEVKLGELYTVHNGLSKSKDFFGSGFPFLSFSTVFKNYFIPEKIIDLVQSSETERKTFSIKKGDVFITRTSETIDELGMSCVALRDIPNATYNGFTKRMRPIDSNKVCPKYIGYFLRTSYFRNKFIAFSNMTTRASLKNEDLLSMTIFLPPYPVQQKIAGILSAYDDLIENNQKQIKLLEEAAQRLYKEWFVDFRFPGHETAKFINGLPERWRKEAFINIFSYVRGKSYSSAEIEAETGILMANLKNIKPFGGYNRGKEKHFNGTYKEEQTISSGDVIMAVTDMTQERRLVGYVARVPRLHKKAIFSMDIIKLIPVKISKIFLYSLLNYGNFGKILSQKANGTNVLHLRLENILDVIAIIPEEKIENNFVKNITPLFNKIDTLEDQICLLQEARDRLLPKLMNGEIEV